MTLPTCPACKATPEVVKVGSEGHILFFVICQSDHCRTRKDNGFKTWYGNPLSNGCESPAKAESDWIQTSKKMNRVF
jgi:hypothetical protein